MEDLIIDYVEGNLKGELKEHVSKTIENNREWKIEFDRLSKVLELISNSDELKPDASLKTDFDRMLAEEIELLEDSGKQITIATSSGSHWLLKIAASIVLLIVGTLIGILISRNQQNQQELMALKTEMEFTRQLVLSSLQNKSSASSRLQGVNTSMSIVSSDDEIVNALVNTMNSDENTNVRLAALNALARFSNEVRVRKELIDALETQDDPVVMIRLINLMVKLKEENAIEPLKRLLENEQTNETIRDEAHLGILKLS